MLSTSFTISVLSRITLLILFLTLLVGLGDDLTRILALPPDLFVGSSEVWRLLTWPLAPSFGALLIGSFAFFTPAEELEGLLGSRTFGLWLLATVLGSGLLHLAIFSGPDAPILAGVTAPAFFVMTGYVYFYPDSRLKVFFVTFRILSLATIMVVLWIFFTLLNVSRPADALLLLTTGGMAIVVSLIWFHGRYQRYNVLPGATWFISHVTGVHESGSNGEKWKFTTLPRVRFGRRESRRWEVKTRRGATRERTELSPAQRADALLEKISKQGMESLTTDERNFLEDYSKRI